MMILIVILLAIIALPIIIELLVYALPVVLIGGLALIVLSSGFATALLPALIPIGVIGGAAWIVFSIARETTPEKRKLRAEYLARQKEQRKIRRVQRANLAGREK